MKKIFLLLTLSLIINGCEKKDDKPEMNVSSKGIYLYNKHKDAQIIKTSDWIVTLPPNAELLISLIDDRTNMTKRFSVNEKMFELERKANIEESLYSYRFKTVK